MSTEPRTRLRALENAPIKGLIDEPRRILGHVGDLFNGQITCSIHVGYLPDRGLRVNDFGCRHAGAFLMSWVGCRRSVPRSAQAMRGACANEGCGITPWWANAGQPTNTPSAPPRSRTGTPIGHRILSAARLPIPPVELGFVYAPSRYLTRGCDPPRGVGVCSPRSWRPTCLMWRSNPAHRVHTRPYLSRRCSLIQF